jgi:hypothetical protein
MQFFYVLINGVSWRLASALIKNTHQYEKTLNRRFNLWSKDKIFENIKEDITSLYKQNFNITDLIIDSTDVINGNCNKKELSKSLKLKKQATKVTIIIDANEMPLIYSLAKPTVYDSKEGYNLVFNSSLNDTNEIIYLAGDKGYQLGTVKRKNLIKNKKIKLVTPKKHYNKKKIYKTKKYVCKIKTIRHSKQMKDNLKNRIKIEHFNSLFHRSFKRLDKILDKSLNTFRSFIDLAFAIVIKRKLND